MLFLVISDPRAAALFDVASNEALHRRLNQWADIIPARFDVHAPIDPDAAQRFLGATLPGRTAGGAKRLAQTVGSTISVAVHHVVTGGAIEG